MFETCGGLDPEFFQENLSILEKYACLDLCFRVGAVLSIDKCNVLFKLFFLINNINILKWVMLESNKLLAHLSNQNERLFLQSVQKAIYNR